MRIIYFLLIISFTISTFFAQENHPSTFISDFKVNTEEYGPQNDHQFNSDISSNKHGNYVIVWEDGRNGQTRTDIYAQVYANYGNPIGPNIKVNANFISCSSPKAMMNNDGSFTVVWKEDYNTILAQRFNSNGKTIGDNKILQSFKGYFAMKEYSISSDENGKFILVWYHYYEGSDYIFAQKYSQNCIKTGDLIRVDDSRYDLYSCAPKVCFGENGNFLVAWNATKDRLTLICAKLFNNEGLQIVDNIVVSDQNFNLRGSVEIFKDSTNNYAIKWVSTSEDRFINRTHVQFISNNGEKIGENLKDIEDKIVLTSYYKSSLKFSQDGSFVVFWSNINHSYDGLIIKTINAQRYSALRNKLGSNIKISIGYDYLNVASDFNYCNLDSKSIIVVGAYSEPNYVGFYYDIYAQKVSILDTTIYPIIKVTDDPSYSIQNSPSITANSNGLFKIVWADNRNQAIPNNYVNNFDVFLQMFDSTGNFIETSYKVNDDSIDADQQDPSISETQNGNFIITWVDFRNSNEKAFPKGDIYAQLYSKDGTKLGNNFMVSESSNFVKPPLIGANKDKFVIVWSDTLKDSDILKAQLYSDQGVPIGTNLIINENKFNIYEKPSIQFSPNGDFIISWTNTIGLLKVIGQYFDSQGNKIGENFQVNTDITINKQSIIQNSINPSDLIVVTWKNIKFDPIHIYAQMYLKNGTVHGSNFRVDDVAEYWNPKSPTVSINYDGSFLIFWKAIYKERNNFYGQLFSNDGKKLGENFRINKDFSKIIESANSKLMNGKLYSVWSDSYDYGKKGDIWANVIDFNDMILTMDMDNYLPSEYTLSQNYPNPFNPITTIKYSVADKDGHLNLATVQPSYSLRNVELKVYDILGREVKILVNEPKQPGNYEIYFDGNGLASGIYYYQLISNDFIKTKKMVLLK